MLSNFEKRIRDNPDPSYARDNAMARSRPSGTSVPCTRYHSQSDTPLPSSRSIIQVLYPPSYLDVPLPFPEPPPYPAQEATPSRPDPLAEDPSLTGVPCQRTPRRRVPVIKPIPRPIANLEEDDPLPAYSRFDQRRPHFPTASDVLGPYPPPSVIYQSTH